ncbi:MAG: PEGA domain-containing protein, partial [Meiothermus sp.]
MLALGLLGLSGLATAAPQLSPQSIIVNPVPTDLQVRTWVDKDPGKTGNPVYQI